MILHRAITKLHAPSVYKITIINRDGNPIYSGTIGYLLNNRKDLLNLDIDGDISLLISESINSNRTNFQLNYLIKLGMNNKPTK